MRPIPNQAPFILLPTVICLRQAGFSLP